MASVAPVDPMARRIRFQEENYPMWKESFPEEIRRQMIQEDLLAGESVSMVLFTLITIGLLLGIVSVLCTI